MKTPIILKEGYITENEKKKAVIIPIAEYRNLLKRLEDLEDALDALKVKKTATEYYRYAEVRKTLKAKGKL